MPALAIFFIGWINIKHCCRNVTFQFRVPLYIVSTPTSLIKIYLRRNYLNRWLSEQTSNLVFRQIAPRRWQGQINCDEKWQLRNRFLLPSHPTRMTPLTSKGPFRLDESEREDEWDVHYSPFSVLFIYFGWWQRFKKIFAFSQYKCTLTVIFPILLATPL